MKTWEELGIDIRGKTTGELKTVCPRCSQYRKKKNYPCLNCNIDKGVFNCWHCSWGGSLKDGEEKPSNPRATPIIFRKPVYRQTPLPTRVLDWFAKRGIPESVLARNRISYGPVYMPQLEQEVSAIQFPYFRDGEVVNVKYRDGHKYFRMVGGAERLFYGWDDVQGNTLVICEGECFRDDAEVLTTEGWCKFSDYRGGPVAQYETDGRISMVQPLAFIRKEFDGELVCHTNTRRFFTCVTPEHQMVSCDAHGTLRKHDALHPASYADTIPRVGLFDGPGVPLSNDQLAFCLAVSADASIRTLHYRSAYAVFAFKKQRKIARLRSLMARLGLQCSDTTIANGYTSICLHLPAWSIHRMLPKAWLSTLSLSQRQFLLEEMVHWDGNHVPHRAQTEYSTKHHDNAVWMQTLAHTCGMVSTIIRRKNTMGAWFKVSVLHKKTSSSWQGIQTERIPYHGKVYCVQVPSGMLLVRQGECISVSGNCDKLALEVAGVTSCVSVPDGAPALNTKNYESKFDYLLSAEALIKPLIKIILAVDNDGPGQKLAEELARRLGPERCWRVTWSSDCKDANDVLMSYGADVLRECIDNAEPWPVSGVVTVDMLSAAIDYMYQHGIERGVSPGWPEVAQHYTVRPGEFTVITGVPSHGKALALDTPLPTPTGWTTMGAIQNGDWLLDEQGIPCKVLATTDSMYGHDCYEMTFSDGTVVVCDGGHEWLTRNDMTRRSIFNAQINNRLEPRPLRQRGTDQSMKRTFPCIATTADISKTLMVENNKRRNHAVQVSGSLQLPYRKLPLAPYVLGAWIGDGTSTSGGFSCGDEEIIKNIEQEGFKIKKWSGKYAYGIVGLKTILRQMDLLGNKHIPQVYLRASIMQRMQLLHGLMDTDGSITHYGRCEFSNTNIRIAEDVLELISTLGWKPRLIKGVAKLYGRVIGEKYRVTFTPDASVFRLSRKAQFINEHHSSRLKWRTIISCNPVLSVPVKCVQVDSPSHLYLATRAFIPTHNSFWVSAMVVNLAAAHGWKTTIFSPENYPLERYAALLMEQYTGVAFDGFTGRMPLGTLQSAKFWLAEHVSFLMPEDDAPTIPRLLDLARIQVYRHGIKGLVLDPWNEIEHARPASQTETEYISHMLSQIRRFARHHGVHVWIVAHPTKLRKAEHGEYAGQYPPPTPYDISGSANFRNKADNCITIWRNVEANDNHVQVHVQKIRFREIGKPGVVELIYEPSCGRFHAPRLEEQAWQAQA